MQRLFLDMDNVITDYSYSACEWFNKELGRPKYKGEYPVDLMPENIKDYSMWKNYYLPKNIGKSLQEQMFEDDEEEDVEADEDASPLEEYRYLVRLNADSRAHLQDLIDEEVEIKKGKGDYEDKERQNEELKKNQTEQTDVEEAMGEIEDRLQELKRIIETESAQDIIQVGKLVDERAKVAEKLKKAKAKKDEKMVEELELKLKTIETSLQRLAEEQQRQ